MKKMMAFAAGSLAIFAAHAQVSSRSGTQTAAAQPQQLANWSAWTRPLGDTQLRPEAVAPPEAPPVEEPGPAEIDVVDAHWMALTMWGEARSQGEEGMRAVGHVIHNRWRSNERYGAYVTDTVSQAYQFSCWNAGDPNRQKMLDIADLQPGTEEHLLWLEAKRLAGEILTGRSDDPTAGSLFYHTTGVQPAWSRGVSPVRQIGNHLFFLHAR